MEGERGREGERKGGESKTLGSLDGARVSGGTGVVVGGVRDEAGGFEGAGDGADGMV